MFSIKKYMSRKSENNILILSFYGASWGGSFIPSLKSFIVFSLKIGRSVCCVFPSMAKSLSWVNEIEDCGAKVYFVENDFFLKKKICIKSIWQLYKIIVHNKIEFIWANFMTYNYSLLLLKTIFGKKLSIVLTVHNMFKTPSLNKIKRRAKLFLIKRTYDKFIGVSEVVKKSLLSNGIDKNVSFVTNAVEFNRLMSYEKIDFRKANDEILVLMFGWPYKVKGVDIAVRAIKKLRDEGINLILLIPHKIQNDLISDIECIPDFVRFIKPRNDVASLYNNVDMFLSASREEGCPYSLIEAAFCECIICSSNIIQSVSLNIPDVILYDTESIDDLSQKIKSIISCTPKQHKEIKQRQKEYVIVNFDMNIWVREMNVYFS